jgi:hypothetical protein
MKKILFIIGLVFILGCNSENAWDCVQDSGAIIEREFQVDDFKKIQVWERVQLIISQGDIQNVRVETGENLMNEIQVKVEDSILTVSDRNSCNWVRDYGITKVYVTTPNIDEIRNSSGLTVLNSGPITFEELNLVSDDRFSEDQFHIDGDFRINSIDVGSLRIFANGLSKFYLSGKANVAFFGLLDGDVRVESANLTVNHLYFFHRSTNKMIVYPRNLIIGTITGLGDVIAKNRPPRVEVEELYTGRLIFE